MSISVNIHHSVCTPVLRTIFLWIFRHILENDNLPPGDVFDVNFQSYFTELSSDTMPWGREKTNKTDVFHSVEKLRLGTIFYSQVTFLQLKKIHLHNDSLKFKAMGSLLLVKSSMSCY